MLVESRNSMKERYVGLVREPAKLSVGKAEEKGGDVASLVATAVHAKEIFTNTVTLPSPKEGKE